MRDKWASAYKFIFHRVFSCARQPLCLAFCHPPPKGSHHPHHLILHHASKVCHMLCGWIIVWTDAGHVFMCIYPVFYKEQGSWELYSLDFSFHSEIMSCLDCFHLRGISACCVFRFMFLQCTESELQGRCTNNSLTHSACLAAVCDCKTQLCPWG